MARPAVWPSALWTASACGKKPAFEARWLACALPYRRFADNLAGALRTARGRCGALQLHRSGPAPPAPCRSPGAPKVKLSGASFLRPFLLRSCVQARLRGRSAHSCAPAPTCRKRRPRAAARLCGSGFRVCTRIFPATRGTSSRSRRFRCAWRGVGKPRPISRRSTPAEAGETNTSTLRRHASRALPRRSDARRRHLRLARGLQDRALAGAAP